MNKRRVNKNLKVINKQIEILISKDKDILFTAGDNTSKLIHQEIKELQKIRKHILIKRSKGGE